MCSYVHISAGSVSGTSRCNMNGAGSFTPMGWSPLQLNVKRELQGKVRTRHTTFICQVRFWHNSGTTMENISLPSKLDCVKAMICYL